MSAGRQGRDASEGAGAAAPSPPGAAAPSPPPGMANPSRSSDESPTPVALPSQLSPISTAAAGGAICTPTAGPARVEPGDDEIGSIRIGAVDGDYRRQSLPRGDLWAGAAPIAHR